MEKATSSNMPINLAKLVYLLCGVIVLALIVSSYFILSSAGQVADEVHLRAEQELVRNEVDRQVEIVARDQSQISNWDDTLAALGTDINRSFIRYEIAEWLWEDFDIKSTIIIGPNGKPRVTVLKSAVLKPEAGNQTVEQNSDLVKAAQKLYMQNRTSYSGGYTVENDPVASETPIFASDIREINGEISIVVAQAIVPDDEFVLPDGLPHIMLTHKSFADEDFDYIQNKLNLTDFRVQNLTSPDDFKVNHVEIGSLGLEATWTPGLPSKTIWKQSLPFVTVLLFMISGSLLLVSIRYSRMLDALQNSEAQNKFLAMHDALTGLPNRLQFDQALEDTISEGHQDRCAILCLDLDRFKVVNDVWGHQAGDIVIQTVADRIAKTVGDDGMTARIGGDEFIVLLKNQLDQQSVLNLCTSIIKTVRKEISFEGGSAQVGASIGVAWWPDDAQTTKNIIRSADEALYRAKENGRGCTYMASNDNAGDVGKFREDLRA